MTSRPGTPKFRRLPASPTGTTPPGPAPHPRRPCPRTSGAPSDPTATPVVRPDLPRSNHMATKLLASALAAAIAMAVPAHARAADDAPLSLSQVRGGAIAADPVIAGNRVYVPTGRVVATWDYTDPAAPIRVATSVPADGAINGLARHGDYL